jgi:hypothetical protein
MPYRSPGPHFEGFPCAAIDPQLWQIVVTSQRPAIELSSFDCADRANSAPATEAFTTFGAPPRGFLSGAAKLTVHENFACAVQPDRGLNASILKSLF